VIKTSVDWLAVLYIIVVTYYTYLKLHKFAPVDKRGRLRFFI